VESSAPLAVAPARRRQPQQPAVQITAQDLELLAFAAEHRFVLAAHAGALWGVGETAADDRLSRLFGGGFLVAQTVFSGHPATYRSTRKGLDVVASKLRAPTIDLGRYDHEIGAAWLWLAARNGAFGPMRDVLGERWLRSRDASEEGRVEPLAVRLGGLGRGGRERLHYPDLLLVDADGRRIAIELELSSKGRERREQILAGYASDFRVAAVLYVVEKRQLAESIRASARRLGISELVHVQRVRWSPSAPQAGQVAAATRTATATRAGAATRAGTATRSPARTAGQARATGHSAGATSAEHAL
jgi:hypothetical protein